MSRIGRMPIEIPAGVTVTYDNHHMNVKGPKGELSRDLHPDMNITVEGNTITVARPSDNKAHRSLHGLTRALVANMVTGVSPHFVSGLYYLFCAKRSSIFRKNVHHWAICRGIRPLFVENGVPS